MDDTIQVRWSGGERTFRPGVIIRIGREPGGDVVLANSHVSRAHAELEHTARGWVLRDLGSAQGTWLNGVRTPDLAIRGRCSVSLGQPPKGEVLELVASSSIDAEAGTVLPGGARPSRPSAAPSPPPPPPPPPPPVASAGPPGGDPLASAGTVIVGASPDRPGGRLRDSAVAGATVVTGDAINLECAGSSYTFQPGRTVTIGRDESCDVVSANPTVSRRHVTLRHDGSRWLLEDEGSAGGTFVDGHRIAQHPLSGSTAAWLGPIDTGERIVLVTSGATKKPSRRGGGGKILATIAVVALLMLLAGLAFVLTRPSGPDDDKLARGTVRIVATSKSTGKGVQGSGTIVDASKGLVLTNAHVVKPTALPGTERPRADDGGLVPDPDNIELDITPGLDQPAEPKYLGKVVAFDGTLDLAVVKIDSTVGGKLLNDSDLAKLGLTEVQLGDSDRVSTGDQVDVFGFPTDEQSLAATLRTGVISAMVPDVALQTNRAYFNTDARMSAGNSGGLAADQGGRLIGVPSILRPGQVGSIRPVNFALPLIAAARQGELYDSPYG